MLGGSWMVIAVLAFSLAAVGFAYVGYPVLIYCLSKAFGRPTRPLPRDGAPLPFVSLLVAAYNEEEEIEQRLRNALQLEYPSDRFEIVVASDGCTDRTDVIVRQLSDEFPGRIRLFDFPENRGKASVLNESVAMLRGEIVVLSDANTTMRADAILRLTEWFGHSDIGVVCGRLVMTDPKTGNNVDSMYWKYETFLKKCESNLGALLGSNGAIYAIRRNLFPGVPHGTIIDDFYIPLEAKRQSGCRIVYDSRAVACEETAPSIGDEFHRRSRIGAGGFQSIGMLWPLLSPTHGWVAFAFFSHKVLRWICPFLLIAAIVSNLLLLNTEAGRIMMALQVMAYLMALVGQILPSRPRALRVFRLPTMFVLMNAALLVGFFKWLFKSQSGAWRRTERSGEGPAVIMLDREALA